MAMTAGAFDEDKQRCLNAGMNDFVSKPVVRADLLRAVERWLQGSSAPAPDTQPIPETSDATRLLDDAVLRELEQDVTADLLPSMVKTFIEDARRRLPCIEKAVLDDDMRLAANEAHALKGAAGTFGAPALQEAAFELEMAGKEGRVEVAGARLPSLIAVARDTLSLMEKRFGIERESEKQEIAGPHR